MKNLVKGSAATVDLRAWVKADAGLCPVETPVPVQVSSVAAAARVGCPVLPPVPVLVLRVLVPVRVGWGGKVSSVRQRPSEQYLMAGSTS